SHAELRSASRWRHLLLRNFSGRQAKKTPPFPEAFRFLNWTLLTAVVVLRAIDVARLTIFLAPYLLPLLRSQAATVGGAVLGNFVVDTALVALQMSRFPRSQRAVGNAAADAILLMVFATVDGIGRILVGNSLRVVLLVVDLLRQLGLLRINLGAIGSGQMTIICLAHVVFFAVDLRFFMFQPRRFFRGERTVLDSLSDAILLVVFAPTDAGVLLRRLGHRSGLRKGRQHQGCQRGTEKRCFHCVLHKSLSLLRNLDSFVFRAGTLFRAVQ